MLELLELPEEEVDDSAKAAIPTDPASRAPRLLGELAPRDLTPGPQLDLISRIPRLSGERSHAAT